MSQQIYDLIQRDTIVLRNHHQINIACLALFSPSKRTEDKCGNDLLLHSAQCRPHSFTQPHCSDHYLFQRLKHRRLRIGLKEPVLVPPEDAAFRKKRQFPLHRPRPAPGAPNNLAEIERFIGPKKR
jgi:hypothetical protein